MKLESYYQIDGNRLSFTREQASEFAKSVAGDFNRIHDVDSKRFCVPGDLLFSVIIHHYGLRETMGFSFSGMVTDTDTLILPETRAREISIYDLDDKKFLDVSSNGETSRNPELIESVTRQCVEYSGHTFPHVLVPLMREHNVMINTDRPLVIYDHMRLTMERLDIDSVSLQAAQAELRLYGKRGEAALNFELYSDGEKVGSGQKKMVLSGLREFEQEKIDELVNNTLERKQAYLAGR